MLEPVSRAIASAPVDEWFRANPAGIRFEEILSDFGLTVDGIRNDRPET
jgi:hypothetical protein